MRRLLGPLFGLLLIASFFLASPSTAHAQSFAGHWINVNLSTQTATAYNGSRPVYTALVTSGRPG
ncbi:MAG TPA: L,D-transpeptidase, partial [Chloroflexota bacterium]|nr:L,D-transpeptidase [Chloroflexota bacterium]